MKNFVKKNWLDIISVVPFGMAFRMTKLLRTVKLAKVFVRSSKAAKLTKISKVSRISKVSKASRISKVSKGLRIKAEIPRTGKVLSKLTKNKKKDSKRGKK